MATGLERLNAGILRRVNAPSSCKIRQVEQTPHETGLCNLSTNRNEFQVFPKNPTSNFYSAVWISRANFIVPEEFSDISSVELTNRKQHLLWFVPQLIQNTNRLLNTFGWSQRTGKVQSGCFQFCRAQQGWSSLQTRHHRYAPFTNSPTLYISFCCMKSA